MSGKIKMLSSRPIFSRLVLVPRSAIWGKTVICIYLICVSGTLFGEVKPPLHICCKTKKKEKMMWKCAQLYGFLSGALPPVNGNCISPSQFLVLTCSLQTCGRSLGDMLSWEVREGLGDSIFFLGQQCFFFFLIA
ncbi:hypothetical protein DPX39_090087500 [Trypanosoma brucei equiperdum]|uniref:Uncharacterized protein n=1 Tax=Trypanosoma brucei equiperdum TaxID=630700 RepID=A0A3L6L120_9TRYP|nr:hypothetical protein DPX39_090087500 [Trypanosoma brucei equiperdum]